MTALRLPKRIIVTKLLVLLLLCIVACQSEPQKRNNPNSPIQDSVINLIKKKRFRTDNEILAILEDQQKNLNKSTLFLLYYNLGKIYRNQSKFTKAVENHQIALEIAKELKDTVKIIKIANQLGTDYRRVGSMSEAAQSHFFALEIAETFSKKDSKEGKRLRSFSLNGIGNIYKNMGNGFEALSYFKRSIQLDKEIKNLLGVAINSVTIGSIMEHNNKFDSAYFYYKKGIHYDSLIHSEKGIAICENRIGQLLSKQGKWEEGLKHYDRAKNIFSKQNDIWNGLRTKNSVALIYLKQKKYQKAYPILKEAKEIAQQHKMYGYLAESYYLLGTLYTEKSDYKRASEAWKACIDYTDKVQQLNNEKKVVNSRVQFERKMSKQQIQVLNKEKELEKSKQKLTLITSSIIVLLLIVLLALVYFLFLGQRKRNQILKDANRVRDKLFSIISHDLKAPAIAQKVAIDNMQSHLQKKSDTTLTSFCGILRESTENQISVIENMMHWANLQTDKIKYNPQAFNIVPIIKDELKLYKIPALQKNIEWEITLPEACIVYADKQMIAIVIRNLLNNAIKFTNQGGKIKVICQIEKEQAGIKVIDNGVGMSEEQIVTFYTKEQNIKVNFGTKGEKGTGLGLILCKSLLEQNQSKLLINSNLNEGTTMQFVLHKISTL